MLYRQANGLTWMYSPTWLAQGVTAAFSTRRGGESPIPYKSLNLALHVGDQADTVIKNRQHWLAALRLADHADPCCAEQVHGTVIKRVTSDAAGRGYWEYGEALPGVDGMITNESKLPLMTFYADCLPVYLFDPKRRAIGLVHSGWKGTAGRISAGAVKMLADEYGSDPADIQAIIGPGIGPCCYAIDDGVAAIFRKEFAEHGQLLYPKNQKGQWYLDLKSAVTLTLIEAGIKEAAIEDTGICTCCRQDLYYSYRGERGNCGRMGALIELG
ncbi:MAG: peptidoglycan editing factor PgeF [Methylocystaceae bacterium]